VSGFLLARIGPHRMPGTFPPALSMRLLNDPRSIAVCVSALPTT